RADGQAQRPHRTYIRTRELQVVRTIVGGTAVLVRPVVDLGARNGPDRRVERRRAHRVEVVAKGAEVIVEVVALGARPGVAAAGATAAGEAPFERELHAAVRPLRRLVVHHLTIERAVGPERVDVVDQVSPLPRDETDPGAHVAAE